MASIAIEEDAELSIVVFEQCVLLSNLRDQAHASKHPIQALKIQQHRVAQQGSLGRR
jgi:hypothetical protein